MIHHPSCDEILDRQTRLGFLPAAMPWTVESELPALVSAADQAYRDLFAVMADRDGPIVEAPFAEVAAAVSLYDGSAWDARSISAIPTATSSRPAPATTLPRPSARTEIFRAPFTSAFVISPSCVQCPGERTIKEQAHGKTHRGDHSVGLRRL